MKRNTWTLLAVGVLWMVAGAGSAWAGATLGLAIETIASSLVTDLINFWVPIVSVIALFLLFANMLGGFIALGSRVTVVLLGLSGLGALSALLVDYFGIGTAAAGFILPLL